MRHVDGPRIPAQPPHSIEAEQSVIGALLLQNALFDELADKLSPDDFYRADHQLIFDAIRRMLAAGRTCDFVTLGEFLRNEGRLDEAGGLAYLGTLATDTFSVANVAAYAAIVRERARLRGLIRAGASIMELGYKPEGRDASQVTEHAEKLLFAIRDGSATSEAAPLSSLIDEADRRIEFLRELKGGIAGLPTGFIDLDRATQGLEPGDLVIVAARPSMGKTSLVMSIAEHVAVQKKRPVGVFSMEMSGAQLALRMMASYARIPLSHLRSGQLKNGEFGRLASAERDLRDAPLYIDETAALTPLELRARARRLVSRYQVQLLIVDYIQLMQADGGAENRTNEVAEVSRSLKALAKELRLPIIALSQLNRGVETRDNKRPRLADLRESGSLEQDADIVLFIYRDEVYNEASPDKGRAEIIIGKQRNGPLGTVHTVFLGEFTRFENLADASFVAM